MNKRSLGLSGEARAADYLKSKGYVILKQNYRFGRNEIDIICEKRGVVVFVEVKARTGNKFGTPIEAVTSDKANKIIKVARNYLFSRNLLDKCKVRFDIIEIRGTTLNHTEDAFRK
ncbi:YraN family protein [candidate division WOR-3 bacterium]|nr:YraN family protein [candidate division WOR-3 bacterium]